MRVFICSEETGDVLGEVHLTDAKALWYLGGAGSFRAGEGLSRDQLNTCGLEGDESVFVAEAT